MTDSEAEDDNGVPWASPEIREAYVAALGRFMLAFNEVDNLLTEVIETVLTRLNRKDLINESTRRDFAFKLLVLDLLKTSREGAGIVDISVDLMREIARHRNKLAHGHFDQNPFDGSYEVVSKNVRADYPAEELNRLTAETGKAYRALRYASAFYVFDDAPPA
jgi:hypothetical protein